MSLTKFFTPKVSRSTVFPYIFGGCHQAFLLVSTKRACYPTPAVKKQPCRIFPSILDTELISSPLTLHPATNSELTGMVGVCYFAELNGTSAEYSARC